MRCWHKDLVPFLPRQQLLGQWRECCAISVNIAKNGTPNHILVNRIMDYPMDHFYSFCKIVKAEMIRRGYKVSDQSIRKVWPVPWEFVGYYRLFNGWHNDIYLRQCLYNLEEKAICGGIPADEWQRIYEEFREFTLWRD